MHTTLEEIKSYSLCESSYKKLLKGLNKTKSDSDPLTFRTIYNISGVDDLFWSIQVINKKKRVYTGALFADTVRHLTKDKRVHNCITMCFKYSRGEVTDVALQSASHAARIATHDTTATAAAHAAAYAAAYAADAYAHVATAYAADAAAYTAADAAYAAYATVYAAYADYACLLYTSPSPRD